MPAVLQRASDKPPRLPQPITHALIYNPAIEHSSGLKMPFTRFVKTGGRGHHLFGNMGMIWIKVNKKGSRGGMTSISK